MAERLRVHSSGRYMETVSGAPVFLLGESVWALMVRTTIAEARQYFQNRQSKGFNVAHCWVTPQWQTTNKQGDGPFSGSIDNPNNAVLNNSFWAYVENVLDEADSHGFYVLIELGKFFTQAMPSSLSLDNWGTQAQRREKAYNVGYRIANRLRTRSNVYFGFGGDYAPDGSKTADTGANVREKVRWMAAGVADGWSNLPYDPSAAAQTSQALVDCPMSFHPGTPESNPSGSGGNSRDYFDTASDQWIAFHQLQSARASRFIDYHYEQNSQNYNAIPNKPTLDTESGYEDSIPVDESSFRRRGWHVRAQAYLALFAGGCGFHYGHLSLWQLRQPGYPDRGDVRYNWDDPQAIDAEGAASVGYARNLMESRPSFTWTPDQTVFTDNAQDDYTRLQGIRDSTGRYAMVYSTNGRSITFDLSKISGAQARAYWFDPRTGGSQLIGEYATSGTQSFDPPSNPSSRNDAVGNDWVLVVDDAAQNYPPPGSGDTPSPRPGFVMAHRGGGNGMNGERPENTLPAFRHAWSNGCNPEGDIRITVDNRIVWMHDITVNRTTNGSGSVNSLTYNQIRQLDAGSWFHPSYTGTQVPELVEVLTAFKNEAPENLIFSIDTKDENSTVYNALANAIGALDLWERVFIEVSNTSVGDALRAVDSRFRLAVWCTDQSALNTALNYAHYERVHMNADTIGDQIGAVHNAGKTAVLGMRGNDTLAGYCGYRDAWDETPDGLNTNRPQFIKLITDAEGLS